MQDTHYHIHWSGKELDWEPFDTREEAGKRARELVQSGETFTIDAVNGDCEKCAEINLRIETSPKSRKQSAGM